MTGFTLPRRWVVEDNLFCIDYTRQLVTVLTSYVAVSALEGEPCTFVVVESRWLPPRRIMTAGTISSVFARSELTRVRVFVATEALLRSRAEIHIFQSGLERWRAMAVAARHTAVRSDKRKFGFRMVKVA